MGVYRGRFPQGKHIPLGVQCRNSLRVPTAPDAAPTFRIYAEAGGAAVITGSLPPTERYATAGLHEYAQFLNSGFGTAGRYYTRYAYAILGTQYVDFDAFEVLAGGTSGGMINSMLFLDRPDGDWIVTSSDAGSTSVNRGPHI